MALLIEHYNGHYPFWLSPRQAIILTVTTEEHVLAYANKVKRILENSQPSNFIRPADGTDGIIPIKALDGLPWANSAGRAAYAVAVDTSYAPRPLKQKLSEAKRKRYSTIIVIGKRNVENGTVNVDFSGISDPHHYLSTDQRLVTAGDKPRKEVTAKELENITMSPKELSSVFDGMIDSYI